MLKHAFKEWAVICSALAQGRQALILRKGGVAEEGGIFRMEHTRFWLFPTYLHQQEAGIKTEALPLLRDAQAQRPVQGIVEISHFVEVPGVYQMRDLPLVLMLNHLHVWSEETVRARFEYRHPGLYVVPARVFRVPRAFEITDAERYAGCRSWVELDRELPTDGAVPVVGDAPFRDLMNTLDMLLNPTALA